MTLGELAEKLGAELTPAEGQSEDPAAVVVTGVAGIETAGASDVTFIDNPKYARFARTTRAAAVIVATSFGSAPVATIRIRNPYLAFARAIELFYQPPAYPPGIHSTAAIAEDVTLGAGVHIGAYVVILEGCAIGDGSVLLPHVVLYPNVRVGARFFAHAHAVVRENCRLGDDVVLQNGAIIGSDGFGFAKDADGRWIKILQSGPAILGDAVEIQANACIDRASVGETRVANGAKIDNLVQVGHGCVVGENTLLCSQVGLAGSTTVGNGVIFAGQSASAGHLTVGDGAIVTAQSGLPGDVAPGAIVSGSPAIDNRAWLRTVAAVNRLPDYFRKIRSKQIE